jgi:cation transport regulator ChaC
MCDDSGSSVRTIAGHRKWWVSLKNFLKTFFYLDFQPGRTVTLVPDLNVRVKSSVHQNYFSYSQGSCWGIAYRVPDDDVAATVDYLNVREKAGYEVVVFGDSF